MRSVWLEPVVVRFEGDQDGPEVVAFGWEHGDEVAPAKGLLRVCREFVFKRRALVRGTLTFVLCANEEAAAQNKRFVRYNLNRLYRDTYEPDIDTSSYEYQRAQQLKRYLEDCNVAILVHAASIADEPFLVVEKQHVVAFAPMGIAKVVTGWMAQDCDTAGDSETYANKHGAVACTIESGDLTSKKSEDAAYLAVLRQLDALNMIEPALGTFPPTEIEEFHIYRTIEKKSNDFQWAIEPKNFLFLPRDTVFAWQLGSVAVMTEEDSYMLIPQLAEKQNIGEYMCFLARKVR